MSTQLFEPLRVGNLTLNHRVVMAPLTRLRADEHHVPLPMSTNYYAQRASVPGTLIIAEATLISAAAGGVPHAPGLFTDAQIQAWKKITDAVHAKGSYIYCQLIALGRAADPSTLRKEGGFEVSAPSAIAMQDGATVPQALSEEEIRGFIRDFAAAGRNAILAGFDGVEVHGANGYLVDQFLQDVSNQRTDQWGGSIENRARFGVEVAKALVEAVGADRVGFRISPWNTWQGMKMADPAPQFSYLVRRLKELGLAYLHAIESRVINNVDCEKREDLQPFLEIWGRATPVLLAGGYTPDNVRQAVEEEYQGYNVAVVFGRHFLANPDLPFRLQHGIPLQKYDRDTFYTPMQCHGYADYPFSSEFRTRVKN
ncbi:NADH:flavin oxidoreductase/NADH oxidase family protein [Aspergillus bombycis]|uniref:NADH:flavin oxidoreductase/NADH oxidase family protein n=1 Tax=Aspergillus bombycis TaxID=109264 RepID=A0A1F7ZN84_9EURO|nr:NADH:flavin oxidoreductase/NADH oxidase family protein [Aspergillus bombycis]OGM40910.1 NADH:flavin oxidoreductase/NADH oxidase family protein [Aspergillus bombycis]